MLVGRLEHAGGLERAGESHARFLNGASIVM